MYFLFAFLFLTLSGCQADRLSVVNQYVNETRLASYHVGTPDPLLLCPPLGQELLITWNLPPKQFCQGEIHLLVRVKLGNGEEQSEESVLKKPSGTYIFSLMNDAFFETEGITAYLVQLIQGDTVIDEWRTSLFYERIEIKS